MVYIDQTGRHFYGNSPYDNSSLGLAPFCDEITQNPKGFWETESSDEISIPSGASTEREELAITPSGYMGLADELWGKVMAEIVLSSVRSSNVPAIFYAGKLLDRYANQDKEVTLALINKIWKEENLVLGPKYFCMLDIDIEKANGEYKFKAQWADSKLSYTKNRIKEFFSYGVGLFDDAGYGDQAMKIVADKLIIPLWNAYKFPLEGEVKNTLMATSSVKPSMLFTWNPIAKATNINETYKHEVDPILFHLSTPSSTRRAILDVVKVYIANYEKSQKAIEAQRESTERNRNAIKFLNIIKDPIKAVTAIAESIGEVIDYIQNVAKETEGLVVTGKESLTELTDKASKAIEQTEKAAETFETETEKAGKEYEEAMKEIRGEIKGFKPKLLWLLLPLGLFWFYKR